jgi:hypothetical protein
MIMTTILKVASTRYASVQQHDVRRCEQGLSPILGAMCPCQGRLFGAQRGDGSAFFAALPGSDPHSFKTLPDCQARLPRPKGPLIGQPLQTALTPFPTSKTKEEVKE